MENTPQEKPRRRLADKLNPVLIKELRGRMRGARAFTVLTVHLLLLSCFTLSIYYTYYESITEYGSGMESPLIGKVLFASIVVIELFVATLISPAFTAGAICGERERQTYELLRTTLLPARKLVYGKLLSALTYMFLLILAALPLKSLAFVMGGVTAGEFILALVLLSVTVLLFASVGLFFSSLVRTTRAATVLSNVTALMITIGLPILMLILATSVIFSVFSPTISGSSKDANIDWRAEAITVYLGALFVSLTPLSAAAVTKVMLEQGSSAFYFWYDLISAPAPLRIPVPAPWIIYTILSLITSEILLSIAVARVRRQEK